MYYFKCKKCHKTHQVEEAHFKQFLTPALAKKLEHASTAGKKVVLEFQTACPMCSEKASDDPVLKLLKIKTTPP